MAQVKDSMIRYISREEIRDMVGKLAKENIAKLNSGRSEIGVIPNDRLKLAVGRR